MKKILILVAAAAITVQSSVLYAVDKSQSATQGQNKSMQMGAWKGDMAMMKKYMQVMMKQMDEIHSTKDLKKREQLMHTHMQNMHKSMQMMRGMGGEMMMGMMGDGKGGDPMINKGMDGNMNCQGKGMRHQMMVERMDMMQMMMEQMMGRMSMQEGMMPKMK
jgi:hypothetical protein